MWIGLSSFGSPFTHTHTHTHIGEGKWLNRTNVELMREHMMSKAHTSGLFKVHRNPACAHPRIRYLCRFYVSSHRNSIFYLHVYLFRSSQHQHMNVIRVCRTNACDSTNNIHMKYIYVYMVIVLSWAPAKKKNTKIKNKTLAIQKSQTYQHRTKQHAHKQLDPNPNEGFSWLFCACNLWWQSTTYHILIHFTYTHTYSQPPFRPFTFDANEYVCFMCEVFFVHK